MKFVNNLYQLFMNFYVVLTKLFCVSPLLSIFTLQNTSSLTLLIPKYVWGSFLMPCNSAMPDGCLTI